MIRKILAPLSVAAIMASASAAFANNSLIDCEGFMIGITDAIATQAELRAGSREGMEQMVCETAQQLDEVEAGLDIIKTILIHIMPADIHTRVIYIPK